MYKCVNRHLFCTSFLSESAFFMAILTAAAPIYIAICTLFMGNPPDPLKKRTIGPDSRPLWNHQCETVNSKSQITGRLFLHFSVCLNFCTVNRQFTDFIWNLTSYNVFCSYFFVRGTRRRYLHRGLKIPARRIFRQVLSFRGHTGKYRGTPTLFRRLSLYFPAGTIMLF